MKCRFLIPLAIFIVALFTFIGCISTPEDDKINGRVHVVYWEKWTEFEGKAMQDVVDDFNKSQDKIYVEKVTISQIEQKIIVAIAGGDPPDLVGLAVPQIASMADKNAILPLDEYAKKAGITREHYIPFMWDMCIHRGKLYGLPTTPATVALHWNKDEFKKAGLDPNRGPRTIKELDEFARKLTIRDKNGNIVQMGFLPNDPGWWNFAWGYWFGGRLWNGKDRITCNDPGYIRAFQWVQNYSKEYGLRNLQAFRSSFGNFSSPQNPFISGKLAMQIQGVWMANFIHKFNPQLNWACAPFPAEDTSMGTVAYADSDTLHIPRGARHPDEAFEFIKYVESQKPMEKLCMGQQKFSPLAKVSDEFIKQHPNPFIQVFIDQAKSPNVFSTPDMGIWDEYQDEMNVAFDRVRLMELTPKEALDITQARVQKDLDRELVRFSRLGWPIEQVLPGR